MKNKFTATILVLAISFCGAAAVVLLDSPTTFHLPKEATSKGK